MTFQESNQIQGLVVLILDMKNKGDSQALFLQSLGQIDPTQIAYMASLFDINLNQYLQGK